MPLITVNPTANESPDSGQGGTSAVATPANTGHAASQAFAPDGATDILSCRWLTFTAVGGRITGMTLKAGFAEDGALSGAGAQNSFTIEYSLNGGSSWGTLRSSGNIIAPASGTASAALSATQNIAQVQVRDTIRAQTADAGESASVTATVSSIRLEVTRVEAQPVVML